MFVLSFFEVSKSLDHDPEPIEIHRSEDPVECFTALDVDLWTFDRFGPSWVSDRKYTYGESRYPGRYTVDYVVR